MSQQNSPRRQSYQELKAEQTKQDHARDITISHPPTIAEQIAAETDQQLNNDNEYLTHTNATIQVGLSIQKALEGMIVKNIRDNPHYQAFIPIITKARLEIREIVYDLLVEEHRLITEE